LVKALDVEEGHTMRRHAIVLAAALAMVSPEARADDLVVWWQTDFHAQEDEAVGQIIAAFEQETGKQVELVQPAQNEIVERVEAALATGKPPDFLFSASAGLWAARWAYEDRLAELEEASSRFSICSMRTP
jgi:ABC-type glycerol-3-phosphate transport system substrate-binding protein